MVQRTHMRDALPPIGDQSVALGADSPRKIPNLKALPLTFAGGPTDGGTMGSTAAPLLNPIAAELKHAGASPARCFSRTPPARLKLQRHGDTIA
jgi:hypothetical protein